MCMNCGCGQIDDRHGDQANIVADDIRRAASANQQDVSETVRNLQASLQRVDGSGFAASGVGSGSTTGGAQAGSVMTGDQGTPRR